MKPKGAILGVQYKYFASFHNIILVIHDDAWTRIRLEMNKYHVWRTDHKKLCKIARNASIKKIIFSSACTVYSVVYFNTINMCVQFYQIMETSHLLGYNIKNVEEIYYLNFKTILQQNICNKLYLHEKKDTERHISYFSVEYYLMVFKMTINYYILPHINVKS